MKRKQIHSVSCLLLLFLVLVGCDTKETATAQPPEVVQVISVKSTPIPLYKDYIGLTKSIESVGIRARVKGFLIKKNFSEGDLVKKGSLLYEIDPAPFKAAVEEAEGAMEVSIANVEFQKAEYERMKYLVKKQAVSVEQYDQAHAQYKEAQGNVKKSKANLASAKINLGYCYMYAPLDGVIGETMVDVGNLVGGEGDTLLAYLIQVDPIYVTFNPSVKDYAQIVAKKQQNPMAIDVKLPGLKQTTLKGKLDLINNQVDQTTSTLLMRGIIENPDRLLLPGIYVNVRLYLGGQETVILLPPEAMMEAQGITYVYTVDDKNKVIKKVIKTTGKHNGKLAVTSGLDENDRVIVQGIQKIQPGKIVKPEDVTASEQAKHD